MSNKTKGILCLVFSALLYSTMSVLIRLLNAGGLPPMTQVFSRYIFAFMAAAVFFFLARKEKIKLAKKDIPLLLITTIFCYALTNLFFTYGIIYTLVSNALFLFYSYAILTPVLAFFLLKEKLNKWNLISILLCLVALFMLFQPNALPTWKLGAVFAILSALGQALYFVFRRKLSNYSAVFMMFANTLVGVIVLGSMSLIFENSFYSGGEIAQVSSSTWLISILFGLINFGAWFLMTRGFEMFKSSSGSMILLIENVFAILFALTFFGEVPTLVTVVGGILVLSASILVILKGEG